MGSTDEDFKLIFKDIDKKKKGYITIRELLDTLKLYGYKCADSSDCFENSGLPEDKKLDMQAYLDFMAKGPPVVHKIAMMRRIFHKLDSDKDGFLSRNELKDATNIMGGKLASGEVDRLMVLMDKNENSLIEIEEFISAFFDYNIHKR